VSGSFASPLFPLGDSGIAVALHQVSLAQLLKPVAFLFIA
jgi:malonyl CoA-acyl carrier protein transacylase